MGTMYPKPYSDFWQKSAPSTLQILNKTVEAGQTGRPCVTKSYITGASNILIKIKWREVANANCFPNLIGNQNHFRSILKI